MDIRKELGTTGITRVAELASSKLFRVTHLPMPFYFEGKMTMANKFHVDGRKTMFKDRHELSMSIPYSYLLMAILCITVGYIRLSMTGKKDTEASKLATPFMSMQMSSEAE